MSTHCGVASLLDVVREPQGEESKSRLSGVLELLLAGTAAIGVVVYAMLNFLYVRFYGSFGVRPEQVGFDRIAVIGRTGAFAISALVIVASVVFVVWWGTWFLRLVPPASKQRWLSFLAVFFTICVLVFIIFRFDSAESVTSEKADLVKSGQNVGPYGALDVRVSRVEVTWLGDETMPTELQSPYLMYLGQGADVAVFLSCGRTTVVVPADQVAVDILDPDEAGRTEFSKACGNP
jgi:hypothetical protein